MKLYIETENGVTKNHPALEDNLIQAFGLIPIHWEPFIRVERPTLGVYQFMGTPAVVYAKVNGVWADVWAVQNMTAEAIAVMQQAEKDRWAALPNRDNFTAWSFNEATCRYEPPIPRPINGLYKWDGATNAWVAV